MGALTLEMMSIKIEIGKQYRLNKKTIYNIHFRFYTLDTDKDKDEKELLSKQFIYTRLKLYYLHVDYELFDIYNDKIEFFNISHVTVSQTDFSGKNKKQNIVFYGNTHSVTNTPENPLGTSMINNDANIKNIIDMQDLTEDDLVKNKNATNYTNSSQDIIDKTKS